MAYETLPAGRSARGNGGSASQEEDTSPEPRGQKYRHYYAIRRRAWFHRQRRKHSLRARLEDDNLCLRLQRPLRTIDVVFLAGAVHMLGLVGFVTRIRYPSGETVPVTGSHRAIYSWLKREAMPCVSHEQRTIIWRPENAWYLLFSLCASTATAAHMVLGIATLGSVQLVAPSDARTIIGRFLFSALICRCVLMFELAGLRERLEVVVEDEQDGSPATETMQPTKGAPGIVPVRYATI